MRALFVTAGAAAIVLASGPVLADAGDATDVRALEQQLAEEHAALSTADCHSACRALASIRRAADKICALEPGPRCDAARDKATDATRRVLDACPDCVIAGQLPTPAPERAASPPDRQTYATAQETHGGCRSCSATDGSGGFDFGAIGLGVLAALRLAGRRSKKDRRSV